MRVACVAAAVACIRGVVSVWSGDTGLGDEALPTDDATWERARGWVLSQAVAILAYYTPENNPVLFREAESWLDLVLSESE